VRGIELARRFYFEAVRPILQREVPDFEHAAALIGWGSDVLGFDDEMSQDHEWGPRVLLFSDAVDRAAEISNLLARELPTKFAGFSTHFGPTDEPGTTRMSALAAGPVAHRIEMFSLRDYLRLRIGVDPREGFTVQNWLTTPTQRLLELTSGEVFVDPAGELARVRELLVWYPHDVWLYAMAGHWERIGQYEHFLGRAGARGDELGSRSLAASLARDVMRLGFLQVRRYAPYAKWLGTAYATLELPERASLERALRADDWQAREDGLADAYENVARRHNALGITAHVDPAVRAFWGRPFRVLFADRFVDALRAAITDQEVCAVSHAGGAIDSLSDNTALLERPELWRQLIGLYDRS
jgi:hypothetical protein